MTISDGDILDARVLFDMIKVDQGEIINLMQVNQKIKDVKLQFGKLKSHLIKP